MDLEQQQNLEGNAADNQQQDPLAGTPFKSVDELVKGYTSLNQKIGEQGKTIGDLTKTLQQLATQPKQQPTEQKQAAPPVDFAAERATVQQAIKKLDPMSDDYQSQLATLIERSNVITAQEQHEKTLNAASSIFKKELDARDSKELQKKFLDKNKDFNTPEMQEAINEFLANDDTGIHDKISAYGFIKATREAQERERAALENEELKKVLNLKTGKEQTGTVIAKGQSPGQNVKPQKVTGRDLDAGMRAVLERMNNA